MDDSSSLTDATDKVDNWVEECRRRQRHARLRMLSILVCCALSIVAVVGARLTITRLDRLDMQTREIVLHSIAIGFFVFPVLFLPMPRWLKIGVIGLPVFGVVVGVEYCGDIGERGHYFTGGLVCLAAFWAMLFGIGLIWCAKKREPAHAD